MKPFDKQSLSFSPGTALLLRATWKSWRVDRRRYSRQNGAFPGGCRLPIAVLSLCIGLVFPYAHRARAGAPISAPPPLAQLIEEGMNNNNEIAGLEQELASQKELIPYAGSLDDPRLGFGAINVPTNSFSFDQEPMTQKVVSLAQKFPWFGKLSLREQRQATIANQQFWLLHAKRLELARNIAVAYYELGYVARGLEINEQLSRLVEQLRKVAESRYETGQGIQQDAGCGRTRPTEDDDGQCHHCRSGADHVEHRNRGAGDEAHRCPDDWGHGDFDRADPDHHPDPL